MGDPFVVDLACERDLPEVWGIVCVTAWNPEFEDANLSFEREYEALRQYLRSCVLNFDEYFYIYPYYALHTTVQTLIPSTRGLKVTSEDKERDCLAGEWKKHFVDTFRNETIQEDTLTIQNVELRGTAGIFLYNDNDTVEQLRDIIDKARLSAESHQRLLSVPFKWMKENMRPTIIHSTFIRNKTVPPNIETIIKEVNAAIQKYKENTNSPLFTEKIKMNRMCMCEETVPYMHTASDRESPKILWEIDLPHDKNPPKEKKVEKK